MHARSQRKYADKTDLPNNKSGNISKKSLIGLLDSLKTAVEKLNWKTGGTEWGDYYEDTNYSEMALSEKKKVVKSFIEKYQPKQIWDLGANTGVFSRIASETGTNVISFDIDPGAVEVGVTIFTYSTRPIAL